MESIIDVPQLRLEGSFFKINKTPQLKPMGWEKIQLIDERNKKEIPNLWVIKKGEAINAFYERGHDRVFLEQDAILYRDPQKIYRKRFNYYCRIPVLISSVETGNKSQLIQGQRVDTFSKQRKISKKQTAKVIRLLRRHPKRLKQCF